MFRVTIPIFNCEPSVLLPLQNKQDNVLLKLVRKGVFKNRKTKKISFGVKQKRRKKRI